MKFFDITLPDNDVCSCNSLYYRASQKVQRLENTLIISKNQKASFDTYFNCFSASKYLKHTNVKQIGISLTLKGSFEINLYFVEVSKSSQKKLLSSTSFNSINYDEVVIFQDITMLTQQGYIYIELISKEDESVFYKGSYFTKDIQHHDTKIALVFCTYHREDYVYRNVANIKEYLIKNPELSDKFCITVIDNGNSLNTDMLKGVDVHKNKNLGGSGGFTRGIIEAIKDKDNTHILLMDDDILFDPKILQKTYSLLATAKECNSLSIGGAMLELDKPNIQYEMGGRSTGLRLLLMKNGVNVATLQGLAYNEIEERINYNAWWYMCMPVSAVIKHGLPLPFFIKGDDVEYGLRIKGDILVLNGIGVWHESFSKKYSGELEYYIKRNELIITSLYFPKVTVSQLMYKMIKAIGLRLVYYRYYEVDLIIKAYEDFLKGADFLINCDAEKLHQQLRKICPSYLTEEELIAKENVYFDIDKYNSSVNNNHKYNKQYYTLNGYLIPKLFYNKEDKQSFRVVDINNTKPINFYKAIKVLQYNPIFNKGFVTRQKKGKLIYAGLQILKIYFLMIFKYKKVCRSYKDNHGKLASIEQWKKLLDI